MGDGQVKKVAIVINGDTEQHHLQNVDLSLHVLRSQGFTLHVASPKPPSLKVDAYHSGNKTDILKLINNVKIDDDDELVIYTTGHGAPNLLCAKDECSEQIFRSLKKLTYGKRTVIMDQCYGGNFVKKFVDDPKTLFISVGSQDETDFCQEFAPHFWADQVPDLNDNGDISWQERYVNALPHVLRSQPQFISGKGLSDSPHVINIENGTEFQKYVKKLKPGQYAITTFSATWCGPCASYKPIFDRLAAQSGKDFLFFRTENEDLAEKYTTKPGDEYVRFPTVMVIDSSQERYIIPSEARDDIISWIASKFWISNNTASLQSFPDKVDNPVSVKPGRKKRSEGLKPHHPYTSPPLPEPQRFSRIDQFIPLIRFPEISSAPIPHPHLWNPSVTIQNGDKVRVYFKDKKGTQYYIDGIISDAASKKMYVMAQNQDLTSDSKDILLIDTNSNIYTIDVNQLFPNLPLVILRKYNQKDRDRLPPIQGSAYGFEFLKSQQRILSLEVQESSRKELNGYYEWMPVDDRKLTAEERNNIGTVIANHDYQYETNYSEKIGDDDQVILENVCKYETFYSRNKQFSIQLTMKQPLFPSPAFPDMKVPTHVFTIPFLPAPDTYSVTHQRELRDMPVRDCLSVYSVYADVKASNDGRGGMMPELLVYQEDYQNYRRLVAAFELRYVREVSKPGTEVRRNASKLGELVVQRSLKNLE